MELLIITIGQQKENYNFTNMPTYQYIDKLGKMKSVNASDPTSAISAASDIDPTSGVQLMKGAPVQDSVVAPIETPKTSSELYGASDLYGTSDDELNDAYDARAKAYAYPSSESLRESAIQRFQQEIDAVNEIYRQKKAEAKEAGLGRIGSAGAIQARRGLLESDFAGAQDKEILDYNTNIQSAIGAEQTQKIREIIGLGTRAAIEEAETRRKAAIEGADAKISEILGRTDRLNQQSTDLARKALAMGIDLSTLSPAEVKQIADSNNLSVGQLLASYKAEQAAGEKVANAKYETLSAGQTLIDPATGKVIYQAPKAAGGSAGLTQYQQFQGGISLASKVDKLNAASKEALNRASLAQQAYSRYDRGETKDLNATTQVIINNFNKILDPSSVVRESEYARSPAGQSALGALEGYMNKLAQGGAGLTKETLKEFVDLGNTFARNAQKSIEQEKKRATDYAARFGIDTSYVGGGYVPIGPDAAVDPQVQELLDQGYTQEQVDTLLTQ